MENTNVFDFKDYKIYLKNIENQRSKEGLRGFRSSLARASQCQTAYISQVFNGNAHFSLEQALSISEFLGHSKEESQFFILIVEFSRAGTPGLQKHFSDLMEEQLQKHLNLTNRFKIKEILSLEDQVIYYSEWVYSAVHMATTIPHLNSVEAISFFLQIPNRKIQIILNFLCSVGLVQKVSYDKYTIGIQRLHLKNDSPLKDKHSSNWRIKALNMMRQEDKINLHYTSVFSLSYEDMNKIKANLTKEIETNNEIIKGSSEQTLACICLDYFSLENNNNIQTRP